MSRLAKLEIKMSGECRRQGEKGVVLLGRWGRETPGRLPHTETACVKVYADQGFYRAGALLQ